MADILTMQDLANGHLDVQALGEAANGDENTIVTTRTGNTYPSAERAINIMFQNGGLPATPFKTKALMTASALVDGKYAQVTDDTVNNGLYLKEAGTWVKSKYDVSKSIKSTLDGDIDLSSFEVKQLWASQDSNNWLTAFPAYKGIVIPVMSGFSYTITVGNNTHLTTVYAMKSKDGIISGAALDPTRFATVAPNSSKTITIDTGYNFLWVSHTAQYDGALRNVLPLGIIPVDGGTIFKTEIVNNTKDGGARVPVSAQAAKVLRDDLSSIDQYLAPLSKDEPIYEPLDADFRIGMTHVIDSYYNISADDPTITAVALTLSTGDVLSFDYVPFHGTVLWDEVTATSGWALLTSSIKNTNITKNHTFIAYKNMTVWISGSVVSSIKVNNATPAPSAITNLGIFSAVQLYKLSAAGSPDYADFKTSHPFLLNKGDTVKITNVGNGHQPIMIESHKTPGVYFQAIGVSPNNPVNEITYTAERDVKVAVGGTLASTFSIKKENNIKNALEAILDDYDSNSNIQLDRIVMPELEYVFATHQNFVLKTEMKNGVEQIAISQDVGKTWTYTPNVVGNIVSYHFYSDGTIQLCSPSKVWWSSDYVTFTQATVYDHDGSVFVPYTHHFFNQQNSDTTMFVGDTELYVWGEYVLENPNPRVWYSTDYGRTVKCAFVFGTDLPASKMNGLKMHARHIHDVAQDKDTESFYITTGDGTTSTYTENHFIKANYDVATDKFEWTVLGSGAEFKLGKLFFDKEYLYFITDYTPDTGLQAKNGIYRVGKNHVADSNKYRPIYICDPAEWGSIAPFRLVMDRHGNKVQLLDWVGQGVIWVATDGMDFKKVTISPRVLLSYVIGPNYSGDVYCVPNNTPSEVGVNANLKLSGGTYNLTKALRNAGLKNFMTGNLLSNGLQGLNAY